MDMSRTDREAENSFAKLKEILLADDQRRISELKEELEKLEAHLHDKEELIKIMGPVIAELMEKKIIESRDEMAEILSPIMSEAIKNQVEYAKDEVVDALYPVIGRTIRKSMAESMRNLVRTVNARIERTLSLRFLFKRIKARAAGVSQADLILRESMPFDIHQVFLIHRETGILLQHASAQSSPSGANQELISGMLTAIQDFAGTLFEGEAERDLNEIQYEDRQIRLEVGRYAYLAFVSSGIPPKNFADEVADLGEEIHKKFLPLLRDFEGRIEVFQPAHHLLTRFMQKYQVVPDRDGAEESPKKRTGWGFRLLLALPLVLLAVYLGVFVIPREIKERKIRTDLGSLTREHAVFADSDVRFDVKGSEVDLTGTVTRRPQKEDIEALVTSRPGVDQVVNRLEVKPWPSDPESLHADVERILAGDAVDLSKINFVIENGILYLEGTAANERERQMILKAVRESRSVPVVVDTLKLDTAEQDIRRDIEGMVLYFETGEYRVDSRGSILLEALPKKLSEISFERLSIIGHADDVGTARINMALSQRRAEWIKSYLVQNGVPEEKLRVIARGSEVPATLNQTKEGRALNRRVIFSFQLGHEVP